MSEAAHSRYLLEARLERAEELACRAGDTAWFSAGAPEREGVNQDAAAVFDLDSERCVLAVADGLGGHAHGERAARAALQGLEEALTAEPARALADSILVAFDQANALVLDRWPGAATTLVVAEVVGTRVRIYHAGDSGALVVGGRGRLVRQTIAHSPVGYALEAGLIEPEDALAHGELHLVSNVIGSQSMHVGVSKAFELRPHDALLLATDGVFDNLLEEEIASLLAGGPLVQGLERVAAGAAQRMRRPSEGRPSKPDDLTALAYRRRRAGAALTER